MRYIPLIFIIVLAALAYSLGFTDYLSLKELTKHHVKLKSYVTTHSFSAPLLYILFYIALTALALPVDTFLVILGGYLFPEPYALIYVTIGASTGATLLFLSAKSAFGDLFFKWASPFLKKMERGFKENAVSYILFLRLTPIFPFWLTNISPAFFGVPLFTYYWTTVVGVIPFAFVFTQAGAGLYTIMNAHQELTVDKFFNSNMKIALFGLGILAFVPIVLRRIFRNHEADL
jgi:uncharacterized membrane protein YdjX (TVP38/TMEM64 family)